MAGWQDVLDDKLALYRFWRSPLGARTAESFEESMTNIAVELGSYDAEKETIRMVRQMEVLKCLTAEPIFVADEMMDLVYAATETFTPEPLEQSDLITPAGFLVLPRPLYIEDRNAKRIAFRIIAWLPVKFSEGGVPPSGIHLSLYSHVGDKDDFNDPDGVLQKFARKTGTPYMLSHVTPWKFGQAVPQVGAAGREGRGDVGWWKQSQSLFRLMLQTISDRDQEQTPRAARKRWARQVEKFDPAPYVTVVRLRRPRQQHDGQEREVEWMRRWLVSGHWRNQWFPSLNAHRQIWVHAHVKGPPDKPLVVRDGHAFEFVK